MTSGGAHLVPPSPAANWRQVAEAAPALAEPITIAEWWKNRRGESIRLVLSQFQGRSIFDLRTWFPGGEGKLKPGKGFAAEVRHLPRLAAAFARAEAKARELGLIDILRHALMRSGNGAASGPLGTLLDLLASRSEP
jgi:Transcriptional Coactivator p15 (PC4)